MGNFKKDFNFAKDIYLIAPIVVEILFSNRPWFQPRGDLKKDWNGKRELPLLKRRKPFAPKKTYLIKKIINTNFEIQQKLESETNQLITASETNSDIKN